MFRFAPAALAALLATLSGGSHPPLATAAGPFDALLPAVPPQANLLVLLDVRAALSSPLARAEDWIGDVAKRHRSGFSVVPPAAEAFVVASQLNLSAMTRDFQIGLIRLPAVPSLRALAERENGTVSDIAGQAVALSPRDVYFATPRANTLAAVYPADRQATARWLRHAGPARGVELAPYLKEAADAAAAPGRTMTVAVDLSEAVDPVLLRLGLAGSPIVIKNKNLNVAGLARLVASARGLTFTADVTDAIAGRIRIDFGFDPTPFRGVLKDLFLELLNDQGASLASIEGWPATFEGNSMTLAGPMPTEDLRRVLSLFAFPTAGGDEPPAAKEGAVSVAATQRYLAAVEVVLADIRRTRQNKDYNRTATWHEKAAAQIDQISRIGIDPVAGKAAEAAANRLRAIAGSLRGVPIDTEQLEAKSYAYSQRMWGWGGWWNVRASLLFSPSFVDTNIPEIQAKIAKVVEDDKDRRAKLWNEIDQGMSAARNELMEKYKAKF